MTAGGRGNSMKVPCLAAVIAAALMAAVCTHAGEAQTRVFPMTRYEAEQVIADWLVKAGFAVVSDTQAEKVVLKATRKGSAWEITLRHQSPVATEVTSGQTAGGRAEDLWRYLSAYQDGSVSARGFPPKAVPPSVLGRKGSVVCIIAEVNRKPIQLTGFVVDSSGLILCTAHMLKNPTRLTVFPPNGKSCEGSLVKIDFRKDLALIDCDQNLADAVSLSNSKPAPEAGQRVFSIGCPRSTGGTVIQGFVSGPPRLVDGQLLLHVRMEVEPGASGSPVFDEAGDLVGMVMGRLKTDHLSGFLVPLQTVISFVKESS